MLENNQPNFERSPDSAIASRISLSQFRREKYPPKPNGSASKREPVTANGTHSSSLSGGIKAGKGDDQYQSVLRTLFTTLESANACGRDPWDFAVEVSELTNAGVNRHLLRVMVCHNLIEHRREITESGQDKRMFEPEKDVVLSDRSCFVLSELGRSLFKQEIKEEESQKKKPLQAENLTNGNGSNQVPIWDTLRRELRLGAVVVKRFKWPASNQEQILRAFQEEGWPSQIDDPLPPDSKICPKRRLHDTIKCLNRRRVNQAIKFRGDGTGQGVLLEIRTEK